VLLLLAVMTTMMGEIQRQESQLSMIEILVCRAAHNAPRRAFVAA
jgi:hypothetical protein